MTKLKDVPGDVCPKTRDRGGKHSWDPVLTHALPPGVKEARLCELCGAMQALLGSRMRNWRDEPGESG